MPNRIGRLNWISIVVTLVLLVAGALISAIAVIVFEAPFKIAPGGVSGIGVILNHTIGAPIGLVILLGNIPIQILAYRMLGGWRVVALTVFFVVIYSAAIDLLTPYLPPHGVSDNILLNALFGGILGGIGSALVYRAGGTGGGTSTLGRIIQVKYGIPLSSTALYTDTGVIVAAGLIFGWESALYAMVSLYVGAAAADYFLEGPSVIRTVIIITDHLEVVSNVILDDLGRGVTAWEGTGMFTDVKHHILYVTISRSQVNSLKKLVFAADPKAFVVIGQGHSAYGQGFREVRPASSD